MPIQPPKCMLCQGAHWSTQPCPGADKPKVIASAVHEQLKQAVDKLPKPEPKKPRKPRGK